MAGAELQHAGPELPRAQGKGGGGESSGRRMLWSGQWRLLLLCCSRCQGNWARNKNKGMVQTGVTTN